MDTSGRTGVRDTGAKQFSFLLAAPKRSDGGPSLDQSPTLRFHALTPFRSKKAATTGQIFFSPWTADVQPTLVNCSARIQNTKYERPNLNINPSEHSPERARITHHASLLRNPTIHHSINPFPHFTPTLHPPRNSPRNRTRPPRQIPRRFQRRTAARPCQDPRS